MVSRAARILVEPSSVGCRGGSCRSGSHAAIEKLLEQERPWPVRMLWFVGRRVRRLTLVSGAIWLLTLPLVMARFHIFNPIAVIINTAVWLPMAGALVSGLALLLCSMIPGPLAAVCAVVCNGLLAAVEWLVRFGEHVPTDIAGCPGRPSGG